MGIVVKKRFEASREQVFEALADFPNAANRVSGIEKVEMLTEGPIGVGTRFKETRVMFKKEATEEMEVTRFDRPHTMTVEAESCGCHYTSVYTLTEVDGGTEVEMDFQGVPVTFAGKLMKPLFSLFNGVARRCVEQDLEDLRTELNSGQSAATG